MTSRPISSSQITRETSASSGRGAGEKTIVRPRRPDVGTIGRSINLLANMFPVTFDSDMKVYHYGIIYFFTLVHWYHNIT